MDIKTNRHAPIRVGLMTLDDVALASFSSVAEPMRAANLLAGRSLYNIHTIPAAGDYTTTSGGVIIPATEKPGERDDYDILMVIAGGDPTQYRDTRVFTWLHRLARKGTIIGGVSGGQLILAAAELLDDYRITIHWEYAPYLMETYPNLILERTLYIMDRSRITVAGGIAPMDMMHALITKHYGPDFARRVSDWFMHTEIRPSGGPQRAGIAERYHITSPALIQTIEAMENHIADPLDLNQLTLFSGTSARQLNRLFQEKLGQRTMAFYRTLRLEKARSLLAQAPLSITDVALATGFANSAHFSRAFREEYGTSPSDYRATQ